MDSYCFLICDHWICCPIQIWQILFLIKNSLFTPYSYRLSCHMYSILVYTSPSMQTRWSFHVHGVHAEGHDTRITCLSCVCGWNNAWLLFMEALANMIVYPHGYHDRDGYRGDRSQGTIYPALFAWVSRPDELRRNILTVLLCEKWLMNQITDILYVWYLMCDKSTCSAHESQG